MVRLLKGTLLTYYITSVFFYFKVETEYSTELITTPEPKICDCTHCMKFFGALYVYKEFLLLFCVFLAWETRKVKIPVLNDSKYNGMAINNVVILSAIGGTVFVIFKRTKYYELLHVVISAVVLLSTTVTLSMVFLPKLRSLYSS